MQATLLREGSTGIIWLGNLCYLRTEATAAYIGMSQSACHSWAGGIGLVTQEAEVERSQAGG